MRNCLQFILESTLVDYMRGVKIYESETTSLIKKLSNDALEIVVQNIEKQIWLDIKVFNQGQYKYSQCTNEELFTLVEYIRRRSISIKRENRLRPISLTCREKRIIELKLKIKKSNSYYNGLSFDYTKIDDIYNLKNLTSYGKLLNDIYNQLTGVKFKP